MKSAEGASKQAHPKASTKAAMASGKGRIHPVVIYPFIQPKDYSNLEELYKMIAGLGGESDKFARPITVMDRKTFYRMEEDDQFCDFRQDIVSPNSDILDAWCVDTCQMWYSGLGMAFEHGAPEDVYWLIPGDFNYGSESGKGILGRLHDLPEIVSELGQDLCIGEIQADFNNSKQLIDTYGTFGLLYNWFPTEARQIREMTERPRSEFFAIRHNFLREVLRERWYAYEQTVVILLKAVLGNKRISRFSVGDISDLPEGKESFAAIVQQVERTERVVKSLWRERNQASAGWAERYNALEAQSEHIRRAALAILQNLLG
jgi:hypothetical protein